MLGEFLFCFVLEDGVLGGEGGRGWKEGFLDGEGCTMVGCTVS